MIVEGIMATEDNYDLLVDTLQDNYGDKTAVKNAHCVVLVTMVKPQHTTSALRTFYDSLMIDMRSLATLDLPQPGMETFMFQHCVKSSQRGC